MAEFKSVPLIIYLCRRVDDKTEIFVENDRPRETVACVYILMMCRARTANKNHTIHYLPSFSPKLSKIRYVPLE